jgi:hypothetical protein
VAQLNSIRNLWREVEATVEKTQYYVLGYGSYMSKTDERPHQLRQLNEAMYTTFLDQYLQILKVAESYLGEKVCLIDEFYWDRISLPGFRIFTKPSMTGLCPHFDTQFTFIKDIVGKSQSVRELTLILPISLPLNSGNLIVWPNIKKDLESISVEKLLSEQNFEIKYEQGRIYLFLEHVLHGVQSFFTPPDRITLVAHGFYCTKKHCWNLYW